MARQRSRTTVKILILIAIGISILAGYGSSEDVIYSSTNFAADILGDLDFRPGTWGRAGAHTWTIQFKPPAGKQVEIISIHGDLVSWLRWGGNPIPGRYAGVLLGLHTSEPEGSFHGDWLADNTFLYIQDAVGLEPRRAPFSVKLSRILPNDNKLFVKVAVWLNDTEVPVHIEPTFTIGYRFVN